MRRREKLSKERGSINIDFHSSQICKCIFFQKRSIKDTKSMKSHKVFDIYLGHQKLHSYFFKMFWLKPIISLIYFHSLLFCWVVEEYHSHFYCPADDGNAKAVKFCIFCQMIPNSNSPGACGGTIKTIDLATQCCQGYCCSAPHITYRTVKIKVQHGVLNRQEEKLQWDRCSILSNMRVMGWGRQFIYFLAVLLLKSVFCIGVKKAKHTTLRFLFNEI